MPLYSSPGLLRVQGGVSLPVRMGSDTNYVSSASLTSYVVSHDAVVGTTHIAALYGYARNAAIGVGSLSWGGGATASVGAAANGNIPTGIRTYARMSVITITAGGVQDMTFTLPVAPDSFSCRLINLSNVGTIDGDAELALGDSVATAQRTGSLDLLGPSVILGSMVAARLSGSQSFTPDTGVVELADVTAGGGAASRHFFGERFELAAGSYVFGATYSQAVSTALCAMVIPGA